MCGQARVEDVIGGGGRLGPSSRGAGREAVMRGRSRPWSGSHGDFPGLRCDGGRQVAAARGEPRVKEESQRGWESKENVKRGFLGAGRLQPISRPRERAGGTGEGAVHSVSPPPVGDMLSPESSPCLSGGSGQHIYVDKFSALVFCVHFPFLGNF